MEKQQNRYITLQKTLSKQEFYILIEKYQKIKLKIDFNKIKVYNQYCERG